MTTKTETKKTTMTGKERHDAVWAAHKDFFKHLDTVETVVEEEGDTALANDLVCWHHGRFMDAIEAIYPGCAVVEIHGHDGTQVYFMLTDKDGNEIEDY